jgi:hypothetical protein
MSLSTWFSISNLSVMPFWVSLILAPRTRWTDRLVRSPLIVLPAAAIYAALVLPALGLVLPAVARPELSPLAGLLGSPLGAAAAWAHFLAFDLFVARWIYLDARERPWPTPLLSGLLLVTLLLGPLGLGAYLAARSGVVAEFLRGFRRGFRLLLEGSRPLAWAGLVSAALLAVNLVSMILDPRQLTGAPLWLKPAKFAASIALALLTLAALLRHLGPATLGMQRAIWTLIVTAGLELLVIDGQALRGVTSHFNYSTRFDGVAFQIMGLAITVFTGAIAYLTVIAFRRRPANRALGWGIRLGFVAMLFGSVIAFLMPRPTAAQLTTLRTERPTPIVGAHAVGVPDGGPGLPVTHWSTEGGDLRVPHFMGLHGLQVLPIAGWWLGRRRRRSGERRGLPSVMATRLSVVAGVGYLGLVATTLVQALRARPLLSPDALTLTLGAGILLGCVVAAAAALAPLARAAVQARRSATRSASPFVNDFTSCSPSENSWRPSPTRASMAAPSISPAYRPAAFARALAKQTALAAADASRRS